MVGKATHRQPETGRAERTRDEVILRLPTLGRLLRDAPRSRSNSRRQPAPAPLPVLAGVGNVWKNEEGRGAKKMDAPRPYPGQ
jgi:hypothetical protein